MPAILAICVGQANTPKAIVVSGALSFGACKARPAHLTLTPRRVAQMWIGWGPPGRA